MMNRTRKQTGDGFTRKDVVRLGAVLLAIGAGVLLAWLSHDGHPTGESRHAGAMAFAATADTTWTVGQLRHNGLRIIPSGSSDASAVLYPDQFGGQTRQAYWIATQIPEVLNQLYCWCGCENRGVHRSNLGCFEDSMGVSCDVCQGTAMIAYDMVQKGITDTGEIQAAVDAEWAPDGA
ncbi:MAG: PCYCGC domain-containing protein [Gemmatimonadetes bacterium]|nr:PCYCGC domain-containing protein [Gemmatimonadota bacterium]